MASKRNPASKPARPQAARSRPTRSAAAPTKTKAAPKKRAVRATAKAKAAPRKPPTAKKTAKKAAPKAAKRTSAAVKTTTKPKVAPAKAPAKLKASPARAAAKPTASAKPAIAPTKAPAKPKAAIAPPPPPPEKPKPRKKVKPELAPREIRKIEEALQAQRVEYLREYAEIEEGAFNVSQSEMSGEASFDEEFADAGSFTFEREKELSIGNNIRDLLDKVDRALAAIEAGTYGICDSCGEPIAKARLLALPYSTLCIKCKQVEERSR